MSSLLYPHDGQTLRIAKLRRETVTFLYQQSDPSEKPNKPLRRMQSKLVEVYHTVEERCHPSVYTENIPTIPKESIDKRNNHYQVYPFL
jgi:hypothetical protein